VNSKNLSDVWDRDGFVVVPGLLNAAEVALLHAICDDVFEQWRRAAPNPKKAANLINMAYLTEWRYFEQQPERLTVLLEAIAAPKILSVLKQLSDKDLIFHNTQYFFNPLDESRQGDWHRDQQFGVPDDETEKLRMAQTVGIHAHIAFLADNNFQYVPGTHARWDTPEELAIRRGANGQPKNSPNMPGAVRIKLEPGDACFFSAWGIHRGNYMAEVPRRTFDIIYGTPAEWATPPPMCFLEPGVLENLQPASRAFFENFINAYREKWLSGVS
jgi:ectoine hydroxylase-related dioxygenase (phytanoyl-CoA dioxygenase family)